MDSFKRKCTELPPITRKMPKPIKPVTTSEEAAEAMPIEAAVASSLHDVQPVHKPATMQEGIIKWNFDEFLMSEEKSTIVDIKGLSKLVGVDIDINHFLQTIPRIDPSITPSVDFVTLPDSRNNEKVITQYLTNICLWKYLNK